MSRQTFTAGLLGILAIAAVDIYGKWWALHEATLASAARLSPFVSFALHKNPGIAFDIPIPFLVILPLTMIICGIFTYVAVTSFPSSKETSLAASAIIIGALGNFFDRALNGFTTDYLIFFQTSAINLSDVLIVLGMIGFLWYHKANPSARTIEEK